VATLLTTKATLASGESFGNVSVTDGGALQGDPVRGEVALHAAVGQHRGNGAFRPGDSPSLPIQCNEGDQNVTINRSSVSINNDTTVSIAIERDAEVGGMRAHLLAECSGVGGTNAIIDNAVSHRKRHDRGASGGECCSGKWRGGAMSRVNHHAQGAGAHGARKIRERSRIPISIRLRLRCMSVRWGNRLQTSCQSGFHRRLKRSLLHVRNLSPIACEHFQAVVFHGVMRCGDHHAAGGARLTGNE
jgi:hypothetical protein